jgi:hypothetical protein
MNYKNILKKQDNESGGKNKTESFFDKFKKIIGLTGSDKDKKNQQKNNPNKIQNNDKKNVSSYSEKKIIDQKDQSKKNLEQNNSVDKEKKPINNEENNPIKKNLNENNQESKYIKKDNENKNSHEDNNDDEDIKVGYNPNFKENKDDARKKIKEGDLAFIDDKANKKPLTERFKEKGIAPKKSFDDIKKEAEEKKKETENKAFSEWDAAQKDLKKQETGYQKVVKKKTMKALEGKVFLVRGKDNGRAAWHYILVPKDKENELKKQRAGTNIDVADFGKIIKSGWGEDPSDEIRKEIEEEYGSS